MHFCRKESSIWSNYSSEFMKYIKFQMTTVQYDVRDSFTMYGDSCELEIIWQVIL